MEKATVIQRNHVTVQGQGDQTLLLAHGFGCDQTIWQSVIAELAVNYRIITFDYVGCGASLLEHYDVQRYSDFDGYVTDLIEVCDALELQKICYVGHSVSGAIGMLAAIKRPDLFAQLILIGPSPRYLNDDSGYLGGFEQQDINDLLAMMQRDHVQWAGYIAPMAMKNEDRPELSIRLQQSFLAAKPEITRRFAQVTFLSDIRDKLNLVVVPTTILYCDTDAIVPVEVIHYLGQKLPNNQLVKLAATGHYPHMSHPHIVAKAIRQCSHQLN